MTVQLETPRKNEADGRNREDAMSALGTPVVHGVQEQALSPRLCKLVHMLEAQGLSNPKSDHPTLILLCPAVQPCPTDLFSGQEKQPRQGHR